MMSQLARRLGLLSLTLIVLFISACGNQSGKNNSSEQMSAQNSSVNSDAAKKETEEEVTLRIYAQYSSDDEKIPYDYAVAKLAEEMPNVKLDLEVMGQDDNQKIKTYAATGNMPDIFQSNMDVIEAVKKSDNILLLDEYVRSLGVKDKMFASTIKLLIAEDGHTYAFPFAGNDVVLWFYNKELFEQNGLKVPQTYDELLHVIKVFDEQGIIPLSIFAKEKWPVVSLYDIFATRVESAGITKLDSGQAKSSDHAFRTAAEKLSELVNAGLLPEGATNLNYDQAAELFYESKAAMFLNGQWEISEVTKKLGDKVDYMYYPAADIESYEKMKYAFSGGGSLGGYSVSAHSKHKELAVKVAFFIAEKMSEARYTLRSNAITAMKVNLTPEQPFPAMMQRLSEDLSNITSTTAFAWGLTNPKFKTGLEDEAQKLLVGSSPDEFMKEMDKLIERTVK